MPRRFIRISLALAALLSSNAWALGLGEIRLQSALNAPFRAEIELLSASADELNNLSVALASQATFERYGLDRPFYLQDLRFEVVRTGSESGNFVRITSTRPVTEPFLTFLVEATWARGRLLREYTVLLDPPTYAPPSAADTRPAVQAPQRSTPTDSARIERQPPPVASEPAPRPAAPRPATPSAEPEPPAAVSDEPFATSAGDEVVVRPSETLWGIASRVRPDSRLSMNQTMLAIFEANPDAFGGNINILRAGATLRIPSADEIYRIDRGYALNEAQRQHAEWGGMPAPAPAPAPSARPSLTLVPPDEEPSDVPTAGTEAPGEVDTMTREYEIVERIAELEAADVPQQRSLIEIRDNELAALRRELAEIRGETYEPPVEEPVADEELVADEVAVDDEILGEPDEELAAEPDEAVDEEAAEPVPPPAVITTARGEPTLVDRAIGWLTSIWAAIAAIVLVVIGVLVWFVRRGRGEEDADSWDDTLDRDELAAGAMSATESLSAPSRDDESIVVVEQGRGARRRPEYEDTIETPATPSFATATADDDDATGQFDSLEDTFSSETAVNLDQSDPIAEADFHMAYGLYDQAADLVNGALDVEPERLDLLSKLCEIYFVWGNRDAFIDAAQRVHDVAGGDESGEWDKIVIMGQQIASDHALFAGAGVAGATKAVDLSFDDSAGGTGALDMDFGSGGESDDDVIDLGAEVEESGDGEGLDFTLGDGGEDIDFDFADATAEMPVEEPTAETPTIEEQFAGLESTDELPSASRSGDSVSDATAEIDLDDLGLDLSGLDETEVASFEDDEDVLDVTGSNEELEELEDTGINEALDEDLAATTGRNPEVDIDDTGVRRSFDADSTGMNEALDIEDALAATNEMRLAADETGQNPFMHAAEEADEDSDVGFDDSLLDATGHTQILSEDLAVDTGTDIDGLIGDDEATKLASLDDDDYDAEDEHSVTASLGDDEETLLAGLDDSDDDFDFAKTEALPRDVFTGNADLDETGEMPAVASTDVDLDLDDLTAALRVSEMGDTVDMPRDDATVEHRRPNVDTDDTSEVPTMSLSPEDMSDDLHEARTMTEVGTKLDLARAYVDMGDPGGARSILEEVLDEGDASQRQQAQKLLDSLPG